MMGESERSNMYERLKEPCRIGSRDAANRLVMPPVATYQATEDGKVTDRMLDYYGERAKDGKIGIIFTEHAYITMQGKAKAKQAGFDGVEIHSAHAYLLNQFYSPLTNHRQDGYGGSFENRIRLHMEVIESVRETVGEDFLVSLRLGGCDYMDGGSSIEDSVRAAQAFERAGIDMISITGGMCRYTRPEHGEPGYFRDVAEAVKKEVTIPVLLTGGVKTAADAEQLLEENAADLIGVGREILKNSHWAKEQIFDNLYLSIH